MQQHHDGSPSAPPFSGASAPHQGQQFLRRLAGLGASGWAPQRSAPEGGAAADDWPDLDQRVRNVGEW